MNTFLNKFLLALLIFAVFLGYQEGWRHADEELQLAQQIEQLKAENQKLNQKINSYVEQGYDMDETGFVRNMNYFRYTDGNQQEMSVDQLVDFLGD